MADFLKKFSLRGKEGEKPAAPDSEKERAAVLPEKEKTREGEVDLALTRETPVVAALPAPSGVDKISTAEERASEPQSKSDRQRAIEDVMAQGLQEVYLGLSDDDRRLVKQEGEKVAGVIASLFETGKAAAKKVLSLLREWLEKIPGVNKYFLEQESKIKTDKIMALSKKGEEELYKQ